MLPNNGRTNPHTLRRNLFFALFLLGFPSSQAGRRFPLRCLAEVRWKHLLTAGRQPSSIRYPGVSCCQRQDPQHRLAMIISSFFLPSTSSALRLSQSAAPAVAKGRSPIFHRGHDGIYLSHANVVFSPRRCRLAVSSCMFIWRVMVSSFNSKGIFTLRPMAWSIGSSLRD
jgi:hypothetical protein